MINEQAKPSTFQAIVDLANPAFIAVAVCVPIGGLIIAMNVESYRYIDFVHIMAGCLWTGIDLFMGFILGPILGRMDPRERVSVFRLLMPKMAFLMPALAIATGTAGVQIAQRFGIFTLDDPRIVVSLILIALLTVQGFGIFLPNEVRIFQELLKDRPNTERVSSLGMFNARLAGLQGVFQLAIIFTMATLRF